MIVVALIAVLSAIAIPRYQLYVLKSRTAEAHSMLGMIKIAEYTNLADWDCFLAFRANPPAEPAPAPLPWLYGGTNPTSFCNHAPYAFQDAGVQPLGLYVHFQYACTAQYRAVNGPTDEFSCSAYADLDADGQSYEEVFCTDSVDTGACIADPQGNVCFFPNTLVTISSAGIF